MNSIKSILGLILYGFFSFIVTTIVVTGIVYNVFFREYINDGISHLNKQLENIEPLKNSEQVKNMVIGGGIKISRDILAYYDLDNKTNAKDIEDYLLKQGYKKNTDNQLYNRNYIIRIENTETPHRITVYILFNNYFYRNDM